MKRGFLVSNVLALALLAPVFASAREELRSRPALRRVPLAGTLRLHGCAAGPDEVVLRARSLPVVDVRTGDPVLPEEETHQALVFPAGVPGVLAFRFQDMASGYPYEIEVPELTGRTDCTKVLWQTADRGIVTVNPRQRVRIEGFAVRSEIEVLAVWDGRVTDRWVGADAVDFTDPEAAVRRFRWKANVRRATSGQLQVSMRPFPTPGRGFDPCATPPLVYSRTFPVGRADWVEIPGVDFARIAGGSRSATPDGPVATDPNETFVPLTPQERQKLELGAPLYVRVAPLSVRGRHVCDADRAGLTPIVVVAKIPFKKIPKPEKEPSIELAGATYDPPVVKTWPSQGATCYRVTKPHYVDACAVNVFSGTGFGGACFATPFDSYTHWLWKNGGVSTGTTAEPGKTFCIPKSTGGGGGWFGDFIDSIGSVITGVIDSVAELVNYASALWEKLQDLAVDATVHAINTMGIPCNPTCRNGLELGLEAGLASMGIPPSIPNFDELVNEGLDYMAAQVAEQTGVPSEISEFATGKAKEFVQKAAASMKASPANGVAGLPDWLAYDVGLQPAVLKLKVFGNVPQLPVTPFLFLASSDVFGGASIALPKKLPPSTNPLTIPVALPINLAGLPEPSAAASAYDKARYNKDNWVQQRLTDGCAELAMAAIAYQDWRKFMHTAVWAEHPTYYLTETGPFYCQP